MWMIAAACRFAYYLIMGYGVYVCWTAYRCSRKRAWLFVGAFCLSAFLGLGMRQLSKVMYGPVQRPLRQTQIVGEDGQPIPVRTISLRLPIAPFLLVLGLSALAADERKRMASAPSADEASGV